MSRCALDDPGLVITHLRPEHVHPVDAVDGSRGLAEIGWISPEPVTTDPAEIDLATRRGALGAAAQLVGLGRRMLDLTVAYVTERRQFGVPIGSFQAVKHHLADARLQLEFAAPAVYRAAWSVATDAPTAGRDVSMAKAMASDAAELVGRKALQCHGAIGYTVDYDLHLYLKRAWALARDWGDAASTARSSPTPSGSSEHGSRDCGRVMPRPQSQKGFGRRGERASGRPPTVIGARRR